MSLKKFREARKTATNPAKITLRNIYAVIQSWFRKKRRNIAGLELPDHIYEQIIWRRVRVMERSPLCWRKGSCTICGCDILGKTMEDRACSISESPEVLERREPCYPEMMSEENWIKYKQLNNINLFE